MTCDFVLWFLHKIVFLAMKVEKKLMNSNWAVVDYKIFIKVFVVWMKFGGEFFFPYQMKWMIAEAEFGILWTAFDVSINWVGDKVKKQNLESNIRNTVVTYNCHSMFCASVK